MKKSVIIIAALLCIGNVNAQSNYEKGMQKAFELWGSDSAQAINIFERIAQAEKNNWLPYYYASQINIINSFGETDVKKMTLQLNKAQDYLNDATAISKNNPELMVLQAMLHTAWIAYDGATYGGLLSGKVAELYNKAELLAPDNPRVVFCKAEWNIGKAQYFGEDMQAYCKDVEHALELFAKFKPESAFYPNWGENRAKQLLGTCKK
ncbi:hypothetical protein [Gaetbulibacter aestuarii]|uniref:Tetratricopeptide repeat protein n=1 Tax=Gaetbulibacter aestuarii TaxID=1502358 RepID=A0ABW7MX68_9FLAO